MFRDWWSNKLFEDEIVISVDSVQAGTSGEFDSSETRSSTFGDLREIIVTLESEFVVFQNVRNMVNRYTCKCNGNILVNFVNVNRKDTDSRDWETS